MHALDVFIFLFWHIMWERQINELVRAHADRTIYFQIYFFRSSICVLCFGIFIADVVYAEFILKAIFHWPVSLQMMKLMKERTKAMRWM